jgi:hypothetical protein
LIGSAYIGAFESRDVKAKQKPTREISLTTDFTLEGNICWYQ